MNLDQRVDFEALCPDALFPGPVEWSPPVLHGTSSDKSWTSRRGHAGERFHLSTHPGVTVNGRQGTAAGPAPPGAERGHWTEEVIAA